MKIYCLFAFIIAFFTIFTIFAIEKTDVMHLAEQEIETSFASGADGRITLSWKPLPYPCFYKVETYSKTTGLIEGEPEYHYITGSYQFGTSYEVPTTAIPMYYRVTAYGIFGELHSPTAPIENPVYASQAPAPVTIYHYDEDHPASLMPFLVWHTVPNAVCYEIELLSEPPATEGGTALAGKEHLASTRQVFTNGYQADLRPYQARQKIYYRVRAMDIQHRAIGEWSHSEPICIDASLPCPDHPLLNTFDQMPDFHQPIYPVYSWIPLHNIMHYEVELLIQPPSEPNGTQPDPNRVWQRTVNSAATCYDEYARSYAGEYYWRVRAVDAQGNTIGTWSDTMKFTVESHARRMKAAALGDSITHGGGSVSYPPSNLEYSYTTYLDFPCLNLGRSGDTAHTTMQRFDRDVLPFQPFNLLILTGSNDIRNETVTADDIIKDLDAIRQKCLDYGIRPVFLTLMPLNPAHIKLAFHTDTDPLWPAKLRKVNDWIKQQDYYIDLEPYFYDATHTVMDPSLCSDGLHPDIRGKMLMGEIINQHQDMLEK